MAASPKSVTIRSYQVGFGDSFLLSFDYGRRGEKHVLIDFGTTSLPKDAPKTRMMDIAKNIEERTGGALDAIVATHRHKDHISGFATRRKKGTGDIIRALKPKVVVQPWTEDPKLDPHAAGPKSRRRGASQRRRIAALAAMETIAVQAQDVAKRWRHLPKELKQQFSFLGENNISNASAVKNLMTMAKNVYVHAGRKSGLESVLPGVTVDVLGPPTVDQHAKVKRQRHKDPDEFWHLQAQGMRFAGGGNGQPKGLFPNHVRSKGSNFPIDTRWLIFHARSLHGQQLLQIVRMLDDAMNNTSVILLFRVGNTRLLFPGDAQIENWEFALAQKKYSKALSQVNLYKVGHHGSLNATPKSLWKLFDHRSTSKSARNRLQSLMSTLEGKHGHAADNTEVPRRSLVAELRKETKHFSTQELEGERYFEDTLVKFR